MLSNEELRTFNSRSPDGGWGWIVMIAGFLIYVNHGGLLFLPGLFFTYFEDEFHKSKFETSTVSALYSSSIYIFAPVSSIIGNKIGNRPTMLLGSALSAVGYFTSSFAPNLYFLYFSNGILAGIGMSMLIVISPVVIGYYFSKWRAFATGFMFTGAGVGVIIHTYTFEYFLEIYGWRGALIMISGIVLNGAVLASLFRRLPIEKELRQNRSSSFDTTLFKDIPFISLFLCDFFYNFASSLPWIIIPVHVNGRGLSSKQLSLIFSTIGFSGISSRVVFTLFGLLKRYDHFTGMGIITLISSFPILTFLFMDNFPVLLILAGIFGFCNGYMYPASFVLTVKLVGVKKLTSALGLIYFGDGLGWLLGPPLAGLIFDKTSSYFGAALLGTIVSVISSLIYFCLGFYMKRKYKKRKPNF